MKIKLSCMMLLAMTAVAGGQSAGSPAPAGLIDDLVANGEKFRATLPSLTADENIVSDSSFGFVYKAHAVTTGTFRLQRPERPGEGLKQSRQITTLNGKPVDPSKPVKLPASIFGGFGGFQQMFFTAKHRPCFSFTLLPAPGPGGTLQLAITPLISPPAELGCNPNFPGMTAVASIDRESHQMVHLERTIPENIAAKSNAAPFVSIDSAPAVVGDQTFWLPTVVSARMSHGQFKAHYSNYHRYAASSTVLPGFTEAPSEAAPETRPPTSPRP